jgi:hypothetical protein
MTKGQKEEYKLRKANSQKWIKNFNATIDEATERALKEEADWIREGLVEDDEEQEE